MRIDPTRKGILSLPRGLILVCFLALAWVPAMYGDVIDRLMAVVDGDVITLGDVKQERALRRFFGDEAPSDDQSMLDEVIEDFLIRNQVDQIPGIQITSEEVEAYSLQLGDPGDLAAEVVAVAVRQRMKLARYVDLRFRQFIRVSDSEIEEYYREVFLPETQSSGLASVPTLDSVREAVRTNVIEEKVNREIRLWVNSLIRRSDIEVVE